jgi:hypothetical protein
MLPAVIALLSRTFMCGDGVNSVCASAYCQYLHYLHSSQQDVHYKPQTVPCAQATAVSVCINKTKLHHPLKIRSYLQQEVQVYEIGESP